MKTVAAIATTGNRESYLEKTLRSIADQFDVIHVYNNSTQGKDYADNAKFFFLQFYKEPIYYFTCDDDIIYPPTYVRDMIKAIQQYKSIVTHHGKILTGVDRSYYHGHIKFKCLREEPTNRLLDVGGTGVMAFDTSYFNPIQIYRSPYLKMADLVFSLEAAKRGKAIVGLTHSLDYFTYQDIPEEQTIYGMMKNQSEKYQIRLANQIFNLKT